MDSACPKELATQTLSDSDHSTKVAPTTLIGKCTDCDKEQSGKLLLFILKQSEDLVYLVQVFQRTLSLKHRNVSRGTNKIYLMYVHVWRLSVAWCEFINS